MIFDHKGLPRDTGASDSLDSCRLAGMMAIVRHPRAPDMRLYLKAGKGVRHPEAPRCHPDNFSRDQLVCLSAGLYSQGHDREALRLYRDALGRKCRAQNTLDLFENKKPWYAGADLLAPSVMLALAKGRGRFALLGRIQLVIDLLFNALFTPLRENNQLIAQLSVMSPRWMRLYTKLVPRWREAVRNYWNGWRGEPELAERIIRYVEERVH